MGWIYELESIVRERNQWVRKKEGEGISTFTLRTGMTGTAQVGFWARRLQL